MWNGNVKTAVANLRSSKARSLLTMTGVIIGITLVVTIVSLGEGLKQQIVGQINNLGSDVLTVRSGKFASLLSFFNSSTLTARDVTALNNLPVVIDVAPIDFVASSAASESREANSAFVLGTTPALPSLLNQKMAYGSFFTDEDANLNFAVIGSNIAHQLYGQLNPVGHSITILGRAFIVHGVLPSSGGGLLSIGQTDLNSAIFINFDQAKNLTTGSTNIQQILFRSKSPNTDATITEVRKVLLASHQNQEDFSVLKQEELLRVVDGVVGNLTRFISALAAISLLVGGIGIMDIMLASVSERTREIGIRKAIGATNRQILNQFLVEGLALTVGGGLIGVIVSLLVFVVLRLYTGLHPVITVPVIVLAVLVSIAVGVIFSAAPALKAARKDPIQALRGD